MILHAAEGLSNDRIAQRLDTRREVVSLWRKRFFEERLAGLEERARPGRPRSFPPGTPTSPPAARWFMSSARPRAPIGGPNLPMRRRLIRKGGTRPLHPNRNQKVEANSWSGKRMGPLPPAPPFPF